MHCAPIPIHLFLPNKRFKHVYIIHVHLYVVTEMIVQAFFLQTNTCKCREAVYEIYLQVTLYAVSIIQDTYVQEYVYMYITVHVSALIFPVQISICIEHR